MEEINVVGLEGMAVEAAEETVVKTGLSKGGKITVVGAVATLIVAGGVAAWRYLHKKRQEGKETEVEAVEASEFVESDEE